MHLPTCHSGIRVSGHLGSGNFASVEKGVWVSSSGTKDVAVKTLHRDVGDANRVKCLQEAAIMAQFHHPNIVLLHGVVIYQDKNVRGTLGARQRRSLLSSIFFVYRFH